MSDPTTTDIAAAIAARRGATRDEDAIRDEALSLLLEALEALGRTAEISLDPSLGRLACRVAQTGRDGRVVGHLRVDLPDCARPTVIDVDAWAGRKLAERHAGYRDDLASDLVSLGFAKYR